MLNMFTRFQATNDALADALKELEASTAALNHCLDDQFSRQSVVSSSGYGTTTSNSSASEEVQVIPQGMSVCASVCVCVRQPVSLISFDILGTNLVLAQASVSYHINHGS